MARVPNIPQKYGSVGDNLLYEALYQLQRAIQQGGLQGRKQATTVQAAVTVNIDNPVVRIVGSATIKNIKAPGFGQPIYVYAQDGVTFSSSGGNIRSDAVLGPGDSAIAQYDSEKDEWFIVGGGGPPVSGFVTDGSNVGGGAEVFKSKVGSILEHRTLKATGGATVTQNADDVEIGAPSVSVGTDEIAYGNGSGGVTSEPAFRYDPTTNTQNADDVRFKRPFVNVKHRDFGAKGDGSTDDTDAIQAAINYAETRGGGTVYFPSGVYIIGKTAGTGLTAGNYVSYLGEEHGQTIIEWRPYSGGAVVDTGGVMLNTTSKYVNSQTIANLVFWKNIYVATAAVTGILGGSNTYTLPNYNSGTITFRDLVFVYLEYGVRGNGVGYDPVSNTKIGIFDSLFDNIRYVECQYGLHTGGSGNVHIKPFFIQCKKAALVMDYISTESNSGEVFLGGTFTQNEYDIYFYDGGAGLFETYRNTNFFGTWFEASKKGIIGYDATVTGTVIIPALNFQGCLLQTDAIAPTGYLLDGTKIAGRLSVNECSVYKALVAHDTSILGGAETVLVVRDCHKFGVGGDVYFGTDAGAHLTKTNAQAAAIGTTAITWDLAGAGGAGWLDVESCCNAIWYTAKYTGTYNVEVRACIEAGAAGYAELRIEKVPVGSAAPPPFFTPIAITHQNFAGAGQVEHMVCTANIALAVGDSVMASVFNNVAVNIIVNPAGFNNPHYNTFSVTREF